MATHSPHATTATELQAVLAAERSDQPFLLHRDEDGELRIVALDAATGITIGRRDTNRVALAWDDEVSRVHYQRFGLAELPQQAKRVRLAEYALQAGLVHPRRD